LGGKKVIMKREALYIRIPPVGDGTFDYIKSSGANPEAIARKAGLKYHAGKEKINYVPWENFCTFYELTAEALNDPYFGIKWAINMLQDLRNMGPLMYVGSLAKNIRHVLKLLIEVVLIDWTVSRLT